MDDPNELITMIIIAIVGIIALALAIIAYRAQVRTGNKALWFVAAAFGLMALKGFLVASSFQIHFIEHGQVELVSAMFDLAVVGLIAFPLLK